MCEFKGKDFGKNGQNLKWWVGKAAAFDRTPMSYNVDCDMNRSIKYLWNQIENYDSKLI